MKNTKQPETITLLGMEVPIWTPPVEEIQNLSVLKMAGYEQQEWCFTCDRPKNDCGCVENGGNY